MYPELLKLMAFEKVDIKSLAKIAELKAQTMAQRLNGTSQFKLAEMRKIQKYFGQKYQGITIDQLFVEGIILFK